MEMSSKTISCLDSSGHRHNATSIQLNHLYLVLATVLSDSDNRLIDQFEDEVKAGNTPQIESFLEQWPEESRHEIVLELISIEIYHRVRNGKPFHKLEFETFGTKAVEHAKTVYAQLNHAVLKPHFTKRRSRPRRQAD